MEKRFLETLSATCNVKAACAEVGLTPASAYAHKKRWQGFADRWKQALEDGYTQLEAGLVFAAGNFLSGEAEIRAHFQRVADGIKGHDPERLARAEKEWAKRRSVSGRDAGPVGG